MIPDPKVIEEINTLSHEEMAKLWRFTSSEHKYFNGTLPYFKIFLKRFEEFGGMTTEMSKRIGLGDK